MILPIAPGAPLLMRTGAASLLVLHIGGATIAILSGWASILARKGGRLHRAAGDLFCVAMLVMAAVGGAVSSFMPAARWSNTTAAVFTLYLVATSWTAARRAPGEIGRLEPAAFSVAAVLAVTGVSGAAGLHLFGERPDASIYVFASLSALAAVCDLRVLASGGLAGAARVARHLWRMSLALIIATASFFLGQQKFLPVPVRGTLLPALPVLGALGLLIFWMIRVRGPAVARLRTAFRQEEPSSTSGRSSSWTAVEEAT